MHSLLPARSQWSLVKLTLINLTEASYHLAK
jgi:hypothetical protein